MRFPRFSALIASFLLTTSPVMAEVPRIVADTPIAHSLTAQVMGDLAMPVLLLEQGSDPHHAQLRPSQVRALSRADLVIWTSGDLSPWLVEVITSIAPDKSMELAAVGGLHHQNFQESALLEHEEEDEHDHEGRDPHLWLNTENAQVWVDAIAERLQILDPENSAIYAQNAARTRAEITRVSQEVAGILVPASGAGLVMSHDAFGYFATGFDLTILGSVAAGDAVSPGAARIAALRAALVDAGAVCIFPEVNHPDAYISLVADGSDLRRGRALDPAGVMVQPGPELYAEVLLGLARSIADCVAGD